VLVAGFLLANRSVDRQQQALSAARAELAATPAHHVSAQTNAFRQTVLNDREQRSLALASALGKEVAWDRVLRRFALVLPDDVWLTGLTGAVPLDQVAPVVPTTSSALPTTATELTIEGYTYSQESVLPDLKNVQLQSSTTAPVGNQNVISFTIVSDIRTGGSAS
jgi:Tfp pilus assembly protein PilN